MEYLKMKSANHNDLNLIHGNRDAKGEFLGYRKVKNQNRDRKQKGLQRENPTNSQQMYEHMTRVQHTHTHTVILWWLN